MDKKDIGVLQQTLVPNIQNEEVPAKKLLQYIASLSSTIGAIAVGMVLSWTNSAGTDGASIQALYGIEISPSEFSWISSLSTLGSGIMCIFIGFLTDFMGRKYAMLLMVVPFTVGWLLIIFANSVIMLCIGRFISGLSAGAFCIAAPMYSAEIAEVKIRGRLGSYFQMCLGVGTLFTYIFGTFVNIRVLSIISAIVPFIFFGIFMFMPESPIYYLKKGNDDAARKSLTKLRGKQYNVENELQHHREALEENARTKAPFLVVLKSKATLKGFIITYGLMLFQQLSGINVIVFYINSIFSQTQSVINANNSTIILGVIQLTAVFVSTMVVDRLGRKILLLLSSILMCLTMAALGVYFYLSENGENVDAISWLPLVSVCIYCTSFSLGFGPVPWMMLGEIFAPEVKAMASSSVGFLSWILAFIVIKFYNNIKTEINTGPTFWMFSAMCILAALFVYFIVPETKGKSLVAIQRELNK
ncbi:facilitated trehalose transporter Tret1 [Megachile rotundata]|uniref:facilitated trehalose transporter Tret1 n=1 Tax=Megachile rotundata TaxID=143995 RepID=UPI000258E727|nr:PREDICTED: facilitated trehalose transporter Tret1 [Megachile rotundata]XP_012143334.1 PREDICTED: facilitated trehalose transporter Tret1 [Megachile rotundata]